MISETIERPSGVSSAWLARNAAWPNSSKATPCNGNKAVAMRLPIVIVPVLSNSSTSTSPAASIARPLMASTFLRIKRSMPAMPMAESRPPIVVGIRQTSSATITVADRRMPLYRASGTSVAQANRKTSVNPTSRMCRANSLGVFCRAAPSTSEIIRSRKDSPGFEVIRTTIRSESTRVPPVTAERSPPLSRITGADSPVIADSSTEAMPSTTSPSPGMCWPASTTTWFPLRKAEAETSVILPFSSLRATVSVRILRSVSAWALPRPSAIASAKFANSTVNHSQSVIDRVNHSGAASLEGRAMSRSISTVVSTLPSSTTNMTGFAYKCCGASLIRLSNAARRNIAPSNNETDLALGPPMGTHRDFVLSVMIGNKCRVAF